jgi:AraC-like DNA-binding protein
LRKIFLFEAAARSDWLGWDGLEAARSRAAPAFECSLLQTGTDLSLAEIAARAGFPDQSVFCRDFKRLVGVTPGRFRMHTRIP